MATDAAKGKSALDASDYQAAITHLTNALKTSQSPLWLIQRSTAYQRLSKHELALADADNAVHAAIKRGKRELIATAHMRRAVALHGLGRFGDARMCLHWCGKYNEKEKGLTIWVAKVKADYDKSGGEDAESNQTTVKEVPEVIEEVKSDSIKDAKENKAPSKKAKGKEPEVVVNDSKDSQPRSVAIAQTPREKIRHEWYQSPTTITIEILAKGVPKDKAEVIIKQGSLEVSFPVVTSNSTYDYTISPLFSSVDTTKSSFRITPHKIEIILHKGTPGKWSDLEGTEAIASTASSEPTTKIPDAILNPSQREEKAPAYPTSSRTGPKNWDTVVDEKDVEDDEDGVDSFFKKLYKDADPDTRRAMMKSYQESNGTALSTDWKDVSKKKVETSPPEGLEAKKWEI